jgi:hypothetical protein
MGEAGRQNPGSVALEDAPRRCPALCSTWLCSPPPGPAGFQVPVFHAATRTATGMPALAHSPTR